MLKFLVLDASPHHCHCAGFLFFAPHPAHPLFLPSPPSLLRQRCHLYFITHQHPTTPKRFHKSPPLLTHSRSRPRVTLMTLMHVSDLCATACKTHVLFSWRCIFSRFCMMTLRPAFMFQTIFKKHFHPSLKLAK